MACNSPYQGPKTDHYDGKTFSAIEPVSKKSLFTVLKWRLTEDRVEWPKQVDITPIKPASKIEGKELRATFVNHSTVLLQTRGLNMLTDPIWSERASPFSFIGPKRVHVPGVAWNDLPKIDVVVISHSHYDHLDLPTVKKLAERDNPLFIVPLGMDFLIKDVAPNARTKVLDWHEVYAFNDDLKIISVPVQHWSARSSWDRNKTLWAGYVFDLPDGKIYFAGDTGYGTGKVFHQTFEKYGAMRFAMLPIGAYEPRWFMKDAHANPDDAVEIFKDVHAAHAMSIHFGTFRLTDEAYGQPEKDLSTALKKSEIADEKFRALKPGETWTVD